VNDHTYPQKAWRPSERADEFGRPRQQKRKMGAEPADNLLAPKFVAYSEDEYVAADDSLEHLLDVLEKMASPDYREDVYVLNAHAVHTTIVAVVLWTGEVFRFHQYARS
jgi:hypothetical protein